MNNLSISEIVEQTALLLEYKEGPSYMTDEFYRLAERVKYLEVPLEVFSSVDLGDQREVGEFENMLGYWFGDFSHESVWNLREVILTGTNPLRDRIKHGVSPNVVGLLQVKSLPIAAVDFVRGTLGIRNVDKLKSACQAGVLSKSNEFTEQEEQKILEDVLKLEERRAAKTTEDPNLPSDHEFLLALDAKEPVIDDPNTIFLANADALADAILETLQTKNKISSVKAAGEMIVKETLEDVRDQARGVVGKFKRFFTSRSDPRYQQMRFEEDERTREQAQRRAAAEFEARREVEINAPLEVIKVGALGRREPAMAELDFLIKTDKAELAFERVKRSDFVKGVIEERGKKLSVSLRPDFFTMPYNKRPTPPVTLNFYTASEFTFGTKETLLNSTRESWEALTDRAKAKGWSLSPLGLYKGALRLSSRTSERLYEKLGLPQVPAELKQGFAMQSWIDGGMPELIRYEDVFGDLHMHSTFSDGRSEIREMIEAARELGRSYIALTDHTQSSVIANGMTDAEFLHYWAIIDGFNEELKRAGEPFRVLKGAEIEIKEEGGLDLKDETLAQADWIIASLHYGKRQPREQLHSRYMDAFRCPYVDAIGHPTDRMIGVDAPLDVDVEFLCENARKYGKCLELNSQPRRLDLDAKWLKLAKEYGVLIAISTDSHATNQLKYMSFGVEQARRAGLTRDDVINTLPYKEFMERRKERINSAPR